MEEKLRSFRSRIEAALEDVNRSLELGEPNRRTVLLDQSSVGRLSRMDALQQQAMASGIKDRLLRQKLRLEAALARMDGNQFGICCGCSEEISTERLEADIATPFCASCQAAIDLQRRSD